MQTLREQRCENVLGTRGRCFLWDFRRLRDWEGTTDAKRGDLQLKPNHHQAPVWVSGTDDNSRRSKPQTWPSDGLADIFPEQEQGGEVSRIHVSGMCLFFQQAFCTVSHLWKGTRFPHLFSLRKERQKEKETTWSSQKPEAMFENWSRKWLAVLLLGTWYLILQNLRSLPTSQD